MDVQPEAKPKNKYEPQNGSRINLLLPYFIVRSGAEYGIYNIKVIH